MNGGYLISIAYYLFSLSYNSHDICSTVQDKQQVSEFKKELQKTLSEMITEDESQKEVRDLANSFNPDQLFYPNI